MIKVVVLVAVAVTIMMTSLPVEQKETYGAALYYASHFEWVELTGPWALTHYGTVEDGYLGQRTGASWNGVDAPDWSNLNEMMPEEITLDHSCIAMPGPEFYGLPVLICVKGVCTAATAVDVPAVERLWLGDGYYMHADLCNKPALELDIVGTGIITGARVYIGRYIGGNEPWVHSESTQ